MSNLSQHLQSLVHHKERDQDREDERAVREAPHPLRAFAGRAGTSTAFRQCGTIGCDWRGGRLKGAPCRFRHFNMEIELAGALLCEYLSECDWDERLEKHAKAVEVILECS